MVARRLAAGRATNKEQRYIGEGYLRYLLRLHNLLIDTTGGGGACGGRRSAANNFL